MQKTLLSLILVLGLQSLPGVVRSAHADTYPGNGNAGFGGAVGNGTLTVVNDGTGGFNFSFTLGGNATDFNGANNNLVVYIDNNLGGGIGDTTAGLADTGDSSRVAVSEFNGTDRSTLTFGGLFNPQYALSLSNTNANVFSLSNNTGAFGFGFAGGSGLGNAGSQNGVSYTSSGSTFTVGVPSAVLGLNSFSGGVLRFALINVSNTGYSSNEATVALNSTGFGYGTTQTLTSVNSFTGAVPEPSTWAVLVAGGLGALTFARRRE